MGTGKRFFKEGMKIPVELADVKELDQSIVLLHYCVKNRTSNKNSKNILGIF